jgi:hypothetical protein
MTHKYLSEFFAEAKRGKRIRLTARRQEAVKRKLGYHFIFGYGRADGTQLSCDEADADLRERSRFYRDNITKCSCIVCGNPRRHFGSKTRQELKAGIGGRFPCDVRKI